MTGETKNREGRGPWRGPLSLLPLLAAGIATIVILTSMPLPTPTGAFPLTRPDTPSDPPTDPPTEPPSDPPPDPHLPPAPPWDPPSDAGPWKTTWPDWNTFVRGPQYREHLGVPIETAHYYTNFSKAFQWSDDSWAMLRDNGFVALPLPREEDIELMYRYYWIKDLPVFITTDTILHAHHLLFDQMLQELENKSLLPMLENMSAELLDRAIQLRPTLPAELASAGTEAVVFFAVPNVLLVTGKPIPTDVKPQVDDIVKKIMAAKGIEHVSFWDGIDEYVDWTQYKPRGHYDRSEPLKRFFRAMMWYGRASFVVTDEHQVLPASVVSSIVGTSDRGEALWTRIYNGTARLVGESDSLNHLDVRRAFLNRLGSFDIRLLADPLNVEALVDEFSTDAYYRQKILSTILYVDPKRAENGPQVEFPKIYQFMGQRYVIDSEIMQNVMFDRVPLYQSRRRGLPSGLDVATALGSSRAAQLLREELAYYNYSEQLAGQWTAVNNKSEDFWNRTAYSRLLSSIREILAPAPNGTPAFAQTRAWASEKVNSGLGSWAELRHDTILYAKQPYSEGITCSTPEGWVEPYPLFFRGMAYLALDLVSILETHFDPHSEVVTRFSSVYHDFANITNRLADIAGHELESRELTPEEVAFIRSVFIKSKTDSYGFIIANYGWLPDLLRKAKITDRTRDVRVVADVATDPDESSGPRVLHVAVGYFGNVVVAYQKPDGDWHLAVGPIYGYYEFAVDGFTRLTDDEWKERVSGSTPPDRPPWASEFLVP